MKKFSNDFVALRGGADDVQGPRRVVVISSFVSLDREAKSGAISSIFDVVVAAAAKYVTDAVNYRTRFTDLEAFHILRWKNWFV